MHGLEGRIAIVCLVLHNIAMRDPAEIVHSRPVPEEWGDLLRYTQDVLAATPPDYAKLCTIEQAALVHEPVRALDNERLEVNRYYGLGVLMCTFAQGLRQPEARARLIDRAASNLSALAPRQGLRTTHIGDPLIDSAFKQAGRELCRSAPPAIRLLGTALSVEAYGRTEALLGRVRAESVQHTSIAQGELGGDTVGVNAAAGPSVTIRSTLDAQFPGDRAGSARIADILQEGRLPLGNLSLLGRRLARLRLDEFNNSETLRTFLSISANGSLAFNTTNLRQPPCAEPHATLRPVLHRARLACPALYVTGLIEDVLQIVPEIIETAQRQVDEKRPR
jgi:hypothetical protein